MDFIKHILFDIAFDGDYLDLLYRFLFFITTIIAIVFLLYFIFTKVVFAGSKIHKDFQLRLNFLWALVAAQFLFVVYFFFVLRYAGITFLANPDKFLAFVPALLVFIATMGVYLFANQRFHKSIQKG